MNLKQIIFLLLPYLFCNACNHEFEDPNTWKTRGDEISNILQTTEIAETKPMKIALEEQGKKIEFDGEVFLVTLENGIKAVFKSLPLDDQGDAIAEFAAYQASRALGFPHIPPTVLREIDGRKGSLQLFVDTPIDLLGDGEFKKAFANFSKEDIDNLLIFYFVFGQWDAGAHNLLAYRYGDHLYPIAIDNSGIRNRQYVKYGDLPFVRRLYSDKLNTNDWRGVPFPFEHSESINDPSADPAVNAAKLEHFKKLFGDRLPESFYKHRFRYILYQNSLWVQYHAFDPEHKTLFTSLPKTCATATYKALAKLDKALLKRIFADPADPTCFPEAHLEVILERCKQVLNFCKQQDVVGVTS